MSSNRSTIPTLAIILSLLLSGCQAAITAASTSTPADPTSAYLAQLDLNKIMDSGSNFAVMDTTLVDANAVVQELLQKYNDVDRGRVLLEVFRRLTAGATSETDKEKAVLRFVQQLSVHDFTSPFMSLPVFDPLILFDIHAMDCQKDSRMIADIYSAAGYQSRLVDMYGHMVAEVQYDGSWHYADADMFGGGQIVTMPDGHIPSMKELSANYKLLDRLQVYLENVVLTTYQTAGGKGGRNDIPWSYPSYSYFSRNYYSSNPGYPFYLTKLNTKPANNGSLFYGWDESKGDVKRERATDIVLSDIAESFTPNAPAITGLSIAGSSMSITFTENSQSQISGYKVYIARTPRGWDYGSFMGDAVVKPYWANPSGWKPAMYDSLFRLPPGDVAILDTSTPQITVQNLERGRYYISIMAVDGYGASIGKQLYPLSNEIAVEIGA